LCTSGFFSALSFLHAWVVLHGLRGYLTQLTLTVGFISQYNIIDCDVYLLVFVSLYFYVAEKFAELHQSKISVGGVVQHGDIQSVKHPEKHTDKQPDKHTDKQPDKHTDKQPDKHTDKQPDKHTDKQPDKHTDKQPEKHTDQQPEKGGRHKKDKKAEKKDKAEKKPDVHKVRYVYKYIY